MFTTAPRNICGRYHYSRLSSLIRGCKKDNSFLGCCNVVGFQNHVHHSSIQTFTAQKHLSLLHTRSHRCIRILSSLNTYRCFHKTSVDNEKPNKPFPKVLYIQNPFSWLMNKLDFGILKNTWDPQFNESEFKRGAKQAVSTISQLICQDLRDGLAGLLTRKATTKLIHDIETSWSDEQRRLIGIEPEDIQVAVPRRVNFQTIVEQKFCDVDMIFVALKTAEHKSSSALIFIEILARFHRNYTEGRLPDWTVSLFRVTRFDIRPVPAG
ncbi:m-AAA protease-interacting protein 1, mitochondrial-like [Schistocerca cancellata]|uniref:m-AAA protease-interacting protein 1, mitochondrial-like n=1 Tax=Schistocerca cancellata TaxID=274614 RepID=UPI0021196EE0|nr:m-AAA protease-interacting protein 1, mitochondrial-like [Schistocerca cancellata]